MSEDEKLLAEMVLLHRIADAARDLVGDLGNPPRPEMLDQQKILTLRSELRALHFHRLASGGVV